MLTVWSVYWGDKYPEYYVHRLQREVAKYLDTTHRFFCLTDQNLDNVVCIPTVSDKKGWWQKLDLLNFTGPNLYIDLDTVITGNLDCFIGTDKQIRVLKNWAQSGHGGCQSSIMYWNEPVEFDLDIEMPWPPRNEPGRYLWGDQEAITLARDRGLIEVDYFDPAHAQSYKYHCRGNLPADCRAVIFHGKPDPDEVRESWFQW